MSDALKRGQHLRDGGAPPFERLAKRTLAVVERLEPRLGFGDPVFGVAQPRGPIDQGLIELAAVFADGVDLVFELGLDFRGLLLLGADRLKLLVALAQRIERGLRVERERKQKSARPEHRASARDESVDRSEAPIATHVTPRTFESNLSMAAKAENGFRIGSCLAGYARWYGCPDRMVTAR